MRRHDTFYQQLVTEAEVDEWFDDAEQADWDMVSDLGFYGVLSWMVVSQHSPADLTVDVSSGLGYDPTGRRIQVSGSGNPDLSLDYTNMPTAVVSPGNSKILSVYVEFDRDPQTPRSDGNAMVVYYDLPEYYRFKIVQGSEGVSPSPPALLDDAILLADVTIDHGATTIVTGDISTSRRMDFVVLTGTPLSIRVGGWLAALQAIVDAYNDHVTGASDAHDATDVNYGGSGNWADGSAGISAGTVEAGIDALVVRLASMTSTSGGDAIGCEADTNSPGTLVAATLTDRLAALRLASNLYYTGGPAWLDLTSNGGGSIEVTIDQMFTDISSISNAGRGTGAAKVGIDALGNFTSGSMRSIVQQLTATTSSNDGALRVGGQAVSQSPTSLSAGTVRSQLDALLTAVNARTVIADLALTTAANDGALRVGAQAVSGSPMSLSSGTVRSQLDALLTAVNALKLLAPVVWGRISCDGLGAVTVIDHEGISSVSVNSTYVQITFSTAFSNTNFSPLVASLDGPSHRHYKINASSLSTTTMRIYVEDPLNNVDIDPSANLCAFSVSVHGRL